MQPHTNWRSLIKRSSFTSSGTGETYTTDNSKLVFPLCDKAKAAKTNLGSGVGGRAWYHLGLSCGGRIEMDRYVGGGFSDGTLKGAYYYSHNGAQVRWMLDFQNWDNGGVDIWH